MVPSRVSISAYAASSGAIPGAGMVTTPSLMNFIGNMSLRPLQHESEGLTTKICKGVHPRWRVDAFALLLRIVKRELLSEEMEGLAAVDDVDARIGETALLT